MLQRKEMQRKFAFFGGSFDPPHFGHLRIIESVLNAREIDKLFLVPNFLNPFKSHFYFSPKLRLKWLRILCKESLKVWTNKIEVLDYEVSQNAPVPTYQTLQFIQQTYSLTPKDKMYLLVGADNVESLHQWQNFDWLQNNVEFVIIPRRGFRIPQNFQILPFCAMDISSTQIRNKLACGDFVELSHLIPQPILELILKEINCKKIDKK